MKRKKLTPKQRVLKKHPGAWLWYRENSDDYIVMPITYRDVSDSLGFGESPREAWADAAREFG